VAGQVAGEAGAASGVEQRGALACWSGLALSCRVVLGLQRYLCSGHVEEICGSAGAWRAVGGTGSEREASREWSRSGVVECDGVVLQAGK
jgi:hypothetical protein